MSDQTGIAPGHLVSGSFALRQPLQAKASSAVGTGGPFMPLHEDSSPLNLLSVQPGDHDRCGHGRAAAADRRDRRPAQRLVREGPHVHAVRRRAVAFRAWSSRASTWTSRWATARCVRSWRRRALRARIPGIVFFSDIFQLTEPTLRWAVRLAGHGFVVAAPEIYHRIEPAGTVLGFDDAGKVRGQADAERTPVADFDADIAAAVAFLRAHPAVASASLGAAGHCTGGHLAFRAALLDDVRATACWYATGLHDGKLGRTPTPARSPRASEIAGELLLIWGATDPHTPRGRPRHDPPRARAGRHALRMAALRRRARLRPRRRRPLRPASIGYGSFAVPHVPRLQQWAGRRQEEVWQADRRAEGQDDPESRVIETHWLPRRRREESEGGGSSRRGAARASGPASGARYRIVPWA